MSVSSVGALRRLSIHRVRQVRELSAGVFVLRFDRQGLEFEPGQYLNVGVAGDLDMREYSIYSGPQEDHLEILVKEVEGGYVSRSLRGLGPGDEVTVEGPFGFFVTQAEQRVAGRYLFLATGTGISPFHCLTRAYPELDYTLLHGVRRFEERYEAEAFDPNRYVACVSGEEGGDFRGRITDYLRAHPVEPETLCYACGNCDMIYEVFDILRDSGVPPEHLFSEVYF